ncbi:MAG: NAD(+) synthase [Eubacteriaceae bacterium]|nr:NAD(+) synthase [Eubacteriaceae bacterium]
MAKPNLGLVRTAAAAPVLTVADPASNSKEIIALIKKAEKNKVGLMVFPELCITGYTCGDLFYQEQLWLSQMEALKKILKATEGLRISVIIGLYLKQENNLFNCTALIQKGKIKGVSPKMFMPNSGEFYEARWFASGINITKDVKTIRVLDEEIPFGNLVYNDPESGLSFGTELCEDLWLPVSPGSRLCLSGAQIIFNSSASNETVGKSQYRKNLVVAESGKSMCGYVYASAGVTESTSDLVFGGHCIISENGLILAEGERFSRESKLTISEIDFQRIGFERSHSHNFNECANVYGDRQHILHVTAGPVRVVGAGETMLRKYERTPFIPDRTKEVNERCAEIFDIQAAGLAKRIQHSHSKKSVVGISGGLDSTLALLVCAAAHKLIGKPAKDIIAVTMPGFGTTGKTYNNALTIMKLLGADVREISIKESVLQHFDDIGQKETDHDITYENSQARERTQILMDVANMENGFVVGTGDLSEMALGWCTYNGDHMSMYGVNCGVPKTLVKFVVKWVMEHKLSGVDEDKAFSSDNPLLAETLQAILDTPISPELLPPTEDGEIAQITEDNVGPYELHDFFIYYTIRYGMTPKKLLIAAAGAFEGQYDEDFIKKWLKVFYRRFFSQQFKRNCVPDGPKVGSVSLSPRGDWRMPADGDPSAWLAELE